MTRSKLKIGILIVLGLAVLSVALSPLIYRRFDEEKYKSLFLQTAGVESVASYLNYDGLRIAELITKNGGYLLLTNFHDASFNDVDRLEIKQIGNLAILCGTDQIKHDGSTTGLDIVQFMENSDSEVRVKNIAQLLENYQMVHRTIAERIPPKGRNAARVVSGNEVYFCNSIAETPMSAGA